MLRASHNIEPPTWRHAFVPALAAYPILHMQAVNLGQIPTVSLLVALAVSIVAALAVVAVLRPPAGSWDSAAIASAAILVLFYLYGPVHTAVEEHYLHLAERGSEAAETVVHGLHAWMSVIWAIATALVTLAVCLFWRSPSSRTLGALNVVAGVAIALAVARLALAALESDTPALPAGASGDGAAAVSELGYNPDIYYIILDGYARADVLSERYGFDNSPFIDGLRELGFQVNDASYANYEWTFLSLSSALNMDYLQKLYGAALPPDGIDRTLLYTAIRDNAVARFLRARGYRYVHFQSTWGATLYNTFADEQVKCHGGIFRQEFYRVIAEASWLKALQPRASADLASCHLSNLDALARQGTRPGPKFVLTHFLPPHHPYLFDRDGNVLRSANLSNQFEFHKRLWERRDLYLGQLQYMNGRVLEAVRAIVRDSPRPPVIVIQSDHGPHLWKDVPDNERMRIRLANFAAYLLPDAPPALMPPDGSPVNQFRRILGFYFGAPLPALPELHYHSLFGTPYRFEAVEGLYAAPGAKRDALPAPQAEMYVKYPPADETADARSGG